MNLLQETIDVMTEAGYKPEDIRHIGNEKYGCTWDEFKVLANKEYEDRYGSTKVAQDLIIMFSDGGIMERAEYDGSEWWNWYRPMKLENKERKKIKCLIGGRWLKLADLNKES